jgi:putative copper resistance protein D
VGDAWLFGLRLIATAAANIALAAAVGSFAAQAILVGDESAWARTRTVWISGLATRSVAMCLVAAALGLWTLAAVMTELPMLAALLSVPTVLVQTHAGRAAALGMVSLTVLLLFMQMPKSRPSARLAVGLGCGCIALFAASRSSASHAGANGALLPLAMDWAHLLSVSLWGGIVMISAMVFLRGPIPEDVHGRDECATFVRNISTTATWTLAGVVFTGAFSSWHALGGTLTPLGASTYGWVLLAKLVCVAFAVALGAHNRLVVMPRLLASIRTGDRTYRADFRAYTGVLGVESLVLLGVLALAALLATSSPPVSP